MASDGSMSRVQRSLMPTLAILTHELRGLVSSWLVRLWLMAAAFTTFLLVAGNWAQLRSAPLVALVLASYLVFPWVLVVIVLGVSPVTGARLDALADGILSRPVTRFEYLGAAWLARVLVVLVAFWAVALPAIGLIVFSKRPVPADTVTVYGTVASLVVVSLVLTFLATLAFFAGTVLRNALLAVVVLVFLWLPFTFLLHNFSLEEFSPVSLSQALPTLLRTPWRAEKVDVPLAADGADVAALMHDLENANHFLSVLSGGATPKSEAKGNFFEQGNYEDFSVVRVLLGYGLPTIAVLGLSMLFFCWRDL
jgi:hypothetical protein